VSIFLKSAALAAIFAGEGASIIAELLASKRYAEFGSIAWPMFVLITLGGVLLVFGYVLAYAHFKNIWIIAAVSIGSILVIEPALAYLLFRETPGLGAWIGLILGAIGTLAAVFI
jgi:hypothetical protein